MAYHQTSWKAVAKKIAELPSTHRVLGILSLSAETIIVGIEEGKNDPRPSIFYLNEHMVEPHYLGIPDAKTLRAALDLAIAEAEGTND